MSKTVILDDWNGIFSTRPEFEELTERGNVVVHHDKAASVEELLYRLRGADVVCLTRERTWFPADVLQALDGVKLLSQTGSPQRHVDIEAATRLGIAVASSKGAPGSDASVVELALGLLLSMLRQIPRNDRAVRSGDWDVAPTQVLHGKTLGVLGLGRIGSQMATVCAALGMDVVAWGRSMTPARAAQAGVEPVSFHQLFERADVLFVGLVLAETTRGLVGADQLRALGPSGYLVNTSRGPIVDEASLVDALKQGTIAGACLDVFDIEPLPTDHPLLHLDNVVLTPHIGWVTHEHVAALASGAMRNALNFLEGNPTGLLNPEAMATP